MRDRRGQFPDTDRGVRDHAIVAQFNTASRASGYLEAHVGSGSTARFFHSRLYLISQMLSGCPGGDLLDVGCGPGMMARRLLDTRPGDFRITLVDRSSAMVEAAVRTVGRDASVTAMVGRAEALPFRDASFDVVLAMGVLEYTDLTAALEQIARVIRPGGLVLVTMLNPMSPYRCVEWYVYSPLLRVLRNLLARLHLGAGGSSGVRETGIQAYRAETLRRRMALAGLRPVDTVAFDVTFLVPPLSGLVRRWSHGWRQRPSRTISRRWRRWLGTAYLVAACKEPARSSRA